MKQELAPRGVGIPGLQAGEDVKKHKHSLPRWQLETHNDKRGVWQHEATWHDGENARGTPRLERAMKEGRDLMDAGETVRIVDLRTGYAHYPNEWDGMVPNV